MKTIKRASAGVGERSVVPDNLDTLAQRNVHLGWGCFLEGHKKIVPAGGDEYQTPEVKQEAAA